MEASTKSTQSGRDRAESRGDDQTSQTLSLTAIGVTLIGVLVSIGVTVAVSVQGPVWLRAVLGAGSTLLLVVVVKATTQSGRGPLVRIANWVIGAPSR